MIISIRIKATRDKGSFIYVQNFNAKNERVGQFTASFIQTSPLLSGSLLPYFNHLFNDLLNTFSQRFYFFQLIAQFN